MEVIFLGTGTSQGVPMIAQPPGFNAANPRNWRTRSSLHVVLGGTRVQVDAAQEFRLQCVREDLRQLDVFLLTHGHADHLLGMDDLRRFCDQMPGAALPVYSTPEGLERVRQVYPYAVGEQPAAKGYPFFRLHEMPPRLELPGGSVCAVRLPHGGVDALGLVFEERGTGVKFAYFCDCKEVPPAAVALARGARAAALDGLRPQWHPTHMNVAEALAAAAAIGAPETYLTHMTFQMDYDELCATLPPGVRPAYDGLRLRL